MLDYVGKDDGRLSKNRKPDPIDVLVGQNVRKIRNGRQMTQEALAAALRLTFQQVQKYEKGENRISASRLVQIAKVLEVDISLLFEGSGAFSHESRVLDDKIVNLSNHAVQVAHAYDAIVCPDQRLALRNLARTMAQAED